MIADAKVVKSQVRVLNETTEKIRELFGARKGSVRFSRHRTQDDLFVLQLRRAHLMDLGSFLMSLNIIIKLDYTLLQRMLIRDHRGPLSEDLGHCDRAFKLVFMDFKLHPWLHNYIFSSPLLYPDEPTQDIQRLWSIFRHVERDLETAEIDEDIDPSVAQAVRGLKAFQDAVMKEIVE